MRRLGRKGKRIVKDWEEGKRKEDGEKKGRKRRMRKDIGKGGEDCKGGRRDEEERKRKGRR